MKKQQQQQQRSRELPNILAATSICMNCDYIATRNKLESSYMGKVYSMLMCGMCKELLQKYRHLYEEDFSQQSSPSSLSVEKTVMVETESKVQILTEKSPSQQNTKLIELLSKCYLLSQYDEYFGLTVHGYSSMHHLQESLSMRNFQEIHIPYLAIQPRDDPLHMVRNDFFFFPFIS